MNLPELFKRVAKLTADNSPALLSAMAITGTLTTAYLTAKATFKAAEIIGDEAEKRILHEIPENRVFPTKDKVKLVWAQYLPPAGMAVTTIGCIVFAHTISTKRLAGMVAAYSLSEKRFAEYKEKALEKFGVNKEQAMRDEIAQERVNTHPPAHQALIMGGGDSLFMDSMSGRYFRSDMETIKKAMNDINYKIISDMYATLSDFYDKIGLAETKYSDEVGWDTDTRLDLHFSTTMTDDGRPAIVVDFFAAPKPLRGHSFHG